MIGSDDCVGMIGVSGFGRQESRVDNRDIVIFAKS
jgi:hypothetical protein